MKKDRSLSIVTPPKKDQWSHIPAYIDRDDPDDFPKRPDDTPAPPDPKEKSE